MSGKRKERKGAVGGKGTSYRKDMDGKGRSDMVLSGRKKGREMELGLRGRREEGGFGRKSVGEFGEETELKER